MSSEEMTHAERKVRASQTWRVLVWMVVLAALVVFGFLNTDRVKIDWIASHAQAPLWAVIGGSALAGVIVGSLLRPRRH